MVGLFGGDVSWNVSTRFSERVPYPQAHVPVEMVPADIVLDENTIARTEIQLHRQWDFEYVFQSRNDIGTRLHTISDFIQKNTCTLQLQDIHVCKHHHW